MIVIGESIVIVRVSFFVLRFYFDLECWEGFFLELGKDFGVLD